MPYISGGNSTIAILGAGGVFPGIFEDVSQMGSIVILTSSPQSSASNGFLIQWSNDGSNVHYSEQFTYVGGTGFPFSIPVVAQWFRINYTNGSTPQASFSMQTIYREISPYSTVRRFQDGINNNDAVTTVKAKIADVNSTPVTGSSSSTPLAGGGTFTAAYSDDSDAAAVAISVFADQAGTLNLDWSLNGVTTHLTESFPVASNVARTFQVPPRFNFLRTRYVNGATPQTIFFLDVFYHGFDTQSEVLHEAFDFTTGRIKVDATISGGGGGAVTIADGADVAEGATTDAAVDTDIAGTVSGKLRGLVKLWVNFLTRIPAALVGGRFDVNVGNAPSVSVSNFPATQPVSGSVSVSNFPATQPVSGTVTADTELPAAAAISDALANPTTPQIAADGMLWDSNAATWRRKPSNVPVALLASAARTTSQTIASLRNFAHRGIILVLNVTANPGGIETLTLRLAAEGVIVATGGFAYATFAIPAATNAQFTFLVYPGVAAAPANPTLNGSSSMPLPTGYNVQVVHSAAGSWTYSLEQHLLV